MKKIFTFLSIVVIIVCVIGFKYFSYKANMNAILKENEEFEQYKDKEIDATDLTTIINRAVDKNTKNKIEKNEQGIFIPNDENSIEIDVYTIADETVHKMEAFYNTGIEQFRQLFLDTKFKCSKIEYHEKTGRIKYILFEQVN